MLPAAVMWLALAGWFVYEALHGGRQALERGLTDFSQQVLAVASIFRDDPDRLIEAIRQVEAIQFRAQLRDAGETAEAPTEETRMQIWLGDHLLSPLSELPSSRPVLLGEYVELAPEAIGSQRWGSVALADGKGVTVRVAYRDTERVAVLWPSLSILITPLLVCLPLLLIPAWFMTRKGLQPLETLVAEIRERAASGELTRLPSIRYRELQPVIDAMNQLLLRLEAQLLRERAFVADVAHEMKTPLAILRTNLDILRHSGDPMRRSSASDDLAIGLDRATHLIGQLLRMARLDADASPVQVRTVDLAEFVRERVAFLVPLADVRGQTLEVFMPATVNGPFDVEAVGAIVDNLIDNAIKYADAHSLIEVELGEASESSELLFSVTDQGPGIDPEMYDKALSRFGRAGNLDAAGAGLGLSIVVRAAMRLGGFVCMMPAPNQAGLRIEVRFPKPAS